MSESNPTPDQGDERRAFVQWLGNTFPHSYDEKDAEHYWQHGHVSALAWQAARALSAAQPVAQEPSQGAGRSAYVADLLNTFEQLRQILGTPEPDADALIATARRLAAGEEAETLAEQCKDLADEMAWAHGDHRMHCYKASDKEAMEQTCNASNVKRQELRQAIDRLAALAAPMPQVAELSDEQIVKALAAWFNDDGNGTFESRMRRAILAAAAPQKGEAA